MSESTNKQYVKYFRWWFWTGAGLITLMMIIGGITRLTGSGLSITDWNLIMGIFPPTTEIAWQEAFSQYKQFPEYQHLKVGMKLGEFKSIFFWEYIHRLLGRITGLVFIIPFLIFWIRGYFTPQLLKRALLLFSLGAVQGIIGWAMVKSGLVDIPRVSHYRLAVHLIFAFLIAGCCVWFALDLKEGRIIHPLIETVSLRFWMVLTGLLLGVQVVWGAFVAGLDAGTIYNTFPLMNGRWLPDNFMTLQPALLNLVDNPGTVQWMHRIIATGLILLVGLSWLKSRKMQDNILQFRMNILLGLIMFQYGLGIITVLSKSSIAAAVFHQFIAMIIWISWLAIMHRMREEYTTKQRKLAYFRIKEY